MPRVYTPGLDALTVGRTFRRSTLWKIEREDGVDLFFTDHDLDIIFGGDTYTPAGGFNSSARQQDDEFSPQNLEVAGMLVSGAITETDLRNGRYRNAKVTEYLVDWKHPWVGAFVTNVYWILETQHTGEHWTARLEGMKRWLLPSVGNVFSRNCRYELGDAGCKVVLAGFTESGDVSIVNDLRLDFDPIAGITATTDYFAYGKLTWTSGANTGLVFDVKSSGAGPNIRLQLPTPNDIEANDQFDVIAGCDKIVETCKTKFSNFVNYGGFPNIPGSDKLTSVPKARP